MSGPVTRRRTWAEVPAELRHEAGQQLGNPVQDFRGRPGGFTPGLAGVAMCANGTEAFIKATPIDAPGATDYRREATIASGLPKQVPAPRLRFTAERAGWLMLCFDVAPGHTAEQPWQPAQLTAVLTTLSSCIQQLTPSPIPDAGTVADRMAGRCQTWRALAIRGEIDGVTLDDLNDWERSHLPRLASLEDSWQHHIDNNAGGSTLLHFDLRADNCLIGPAGEVSFVDWGRACIGPAWVDLVCLMLESDLGDIDPEHLFTSHPLGHHADPDAVDGFLVALAGYWAHAGRQPPITHAPGLRQQQARSGQATLRWLRQRWTTR